MKNKYPKYCVKNTKPPHHTKLIQSVILSGKDAKIIPQDMHNYIMNTCGDDNIQKHDHKNWFILKVVQIMSINGE